MSTSKIAAMTLAGLMSTGVLAAGMSDDDHMKDKDGHGSMSSGTHSDSSYGNKDDTMMDGKTTDDTDRRGLTTGTGVTTESGDPAGPGTATGTAVGNTTGTGNSATGAGSGGAGN